MMGASKDDLASSRWASPPGRRTKTSTVLLPTFLPPPPPTPPHLPRPVSPTKPPSRSPHRQHPTAHTTPSTRSSSTAPPIIPQSTTIHARQQSLALLARLVPRLKWRASLLLTSLAFATNPVDHGVGLTPAQADVQFRVDFFEFYVLLERVLLGLLACVGVKVSRFAVMGFDGGGGGGTGGGGGSSAPREDAGARGGRGGSIIGDGKVIPSSHAFHANVLAALSQLENNPLYGILGVGQAREYIALAKDLRNGWKESAAGDVDFDLDVAAAAAEHDTGRVSTAAADHGHGYQHPPAQRKLNNPDGGQVPDDAERLAERLKRRYADLLRELRLDEMLRVILIAVEEATVVARKEVARLADADLGLAGARVARPSERIVSVEMTDVEFKTERGPVESMGGGWGGEEVEMEL